MLAWFLAWSTGAHAEPAEVRVAEDGETVVAVGIVPASTDAIRSTLADPATMRELFPDVLSVSAVPDGSCQDVRRDTRGVFSPLHLHVRRCPTASGFREDLVPDDGTFQAYTSEWRLTPTEAGTRVEYRVKLAISLPIPRLALLSGVEQASKQAVQRLIEKYSR